MPEGWKAFPYLSALHRPEIPPSFLVFIDPADGLIKAKNGRTGVIDFSGPDASTVIQSALNALTSGRTWTEKVVLKGEFDLPYYPHVPPYAEIEIIGRLNVNSKAAIMIVFDDIIDTQYSTYFPIMKSFGFRGVMAAVSDWVDTIGHLTTAQLKEMVDAGFSIASHSKSHVNIKTANSSAAEIEFRESKEWLERNLGIRVDAFVFPFAAIGAGNWEIGRQYYNYFWQSGTKAWPNYTWNWITDQLNTYYTPDGPVVDAAINWAISNKELSIITFHATETAQVFTSLMQKIKDSGLPVVNIQDINLYLNRPPKPTYAQPHPLTINRLKGVLPVATIFDTNPPTLANVTDGDWTTDSGTGIKSLAGVNGDIGYLLFNMGADYPVLVVAKINQHRASGDGSVTCYLQQSPDNISWSSTQSLIGSTSADHFKVMVAGFAVQQYLRLLWISTSVTVNPSVFHVVVAEVMAIQLV